MKEYSLIKGISPWHNKNTSSIERDALLPFVQRSFLSTIIHDGVSLWKNQGVSK